MIVELWAFSCRPSPSIDAIDQSRALCTAVELLWRRNIRGRLRAQTVSSQTRMTRRLNIKNGNRTWHPQSALHIWRTVTVTWATTWITCDCSTPPAQSSIYTNLPQKKKKLILVLTLNPRLIILLGLIKDFSFPLLFHSLCTLCTLCRKSSVGIGPADWTLQINEVITEHDVYSTIRGNVMWKETTSLAEVHKRLSGKLTTITMSRYQTLFRISLMRIEGDRNLHWHLSAKKSSRHWFQIYGTAVAYVPYKPQPYSTGYHCTNCTARFRHFTNT